MRRLALALAALGLLAIAPAAMAARAPDLTVKDAGVLNPVLVPGGKTKISVIVQNKGRAPARKAVVRFFLVPDKGKRKPLRGRAVVRKLKPRKTKTVSASVRVPGNLKPGSFSMLACVDSGADDANAHNDCPKPKKAEPIGVLEKPGPNKSVSPQVAESHVGGKGVISRDGGSLSAYTPDFKTVYTLIVPPGALARDQYVEIKPLATVDGLPFAGGLTAGVQLEPSGVEFSKPAAVVISGEGIQPSSDDVAFGYNAAGRDFRLAAQFLEVPDFVRSYYSYDPERSIVIPVEHFSGVGVTPATDQETAVQMRHDAADARDRLAQEMAKEIKDARDGKDNDLSSVTEKILYDYLEQVLLPEAAAASFSDAMYESAVRDIISWERQRQLLGESEALPSRYRALMSRIEQLMEIAWEKLIIRAENRCYAGDFSIIARIIPLERQRQLLGASESAGRNEFSEAFVRCFKFEFKFRSRVTHKGSGDLGGGWSGSTDETYAVAATVPLAIEGESLEVLGADLKGTAPLTYTSVSNTGDGSVSFGAAGGGQCTYQSTGNTQAGLVNVTQGGIGLTISGSDVKRSYPPFLSFDLGDPQEQINHKCHGDAFGQSYNSDENYWERNFMRWWNWAHSDERVNPDEGNNSPDGPFPGPWQSIFEQTIYPKVGTYTLDVSDADYGTRVTDAWELTHTPPPRRAG